MPHPLVIAGFIGLTAFTIAMIVSDVMKGHGENQYGCCNRRDEDQEDLPPYSRNDPSHNDIIPKNIESDLINPTPGSSTNPMGTNFLNMELDLEALQLETSERELEAETERLGSEIRRRQNEQRKKKLEELSKTIEQQREILAKYEAERNGFFP